MQSRTFTGSFKTHIVRGDGPAGALKDTLSVLYGGGAYQGRPYFLGLEDRGRLESLPIKQQLAKWVAYSSIEQSAANAYFFLLEHGNVIAVNLDPSAIVFEKASVLPSRMNVKAA